MVHPSSAHPLPPRLNLPSVWRCGDLNVVGEVESEIGSADLDHLENAPRPSSPSDSNSNPRSIRSIFDHFLTPFINCVQPPLQSCVETTTSDATVYPSSPQQQPPPPQRWGPPHVPVVQSHTAAVFVTPRTSPAPFALPLFDITNPLEYDIICGRGGSSVKHVGNLAFRDLIAANRAQYATLTKKQKMSMARQIVDTVRRRGRFLAKDPQTGLWHDIGMPRSLEKTSQALREKAVGATTSTTESPTTLDVSAPTTSPTTPRSKSPGVESIQIQIPQHLIPLYGIVPSSPMYVPHLLTPILGPSAEPPPRPYYPSTPTIMQRHNEAPPTTATRTTTTTIPWELPIILRSNSVDTSVGSDVGLLSMPMESASPSSFSVHRRDWKRQRTSPFLVRGATTATTTTTRSFMSSNHHHHPHSPNHVVASRSFSRLSLEEKVVGRELATSPGRELATLPSLMGRELASPSLVVLPRSRSTPSHQPPHPPPMDGLTALSTAAYLQLDATY